MESQHSKNETSLAPCIQQFFGSGEKFQDLSNTTHSYNSVFNFLTGEAGNLNYLLKCTDGIFSGKFLYINTTPDGELFGSGDPEKIDLTMYIEQAELSERHAEIKFVDNYRYILRDCGSETGTWVRVRELDLYQESRQRVFKAGAYQFAVYESKILLSRKGN